MGPVTYMVVEFPGSQFKGEIAPALRELVDNRQIRILDLVLVKKNADGSIESVELSSLSESDSELAARLAGLETTALGILNYNDIEILAGALENDSSAAILLFENLWAERFADAITNANGRWVLLESVPSDVLAAALAEQAED